MANLQWSAFKAMVEERLSEEGITDAPIDYFDFNGGMGKYIDLILVDGELSAS